MSGNQVVKDRSMKSNLVSGTHCVSKHNLTTFGGEDSEIQT